MPTDTRTERTEELTEELGDAMPPDADAGLAERYAAAVMGDELGRPGAALELDLLAPMFAGNPAAEAVEAALRAEAAAERADRIRHRWR